MTSKDKEMLKKTRNYNNYSIAYSNNIIYGDIMLTYPGLFVGVYNKKETLIGLLFKDISISDHVITKRDGIYNTVILGNDNALTLSLEIGRQEGSLLVKDEFSVSVKDCVKLFSYNIEIKCHVSLDGVVYYDRESIIRSHTLNNIIND